MRLGMTLTDLATELERQSSQKRDFLALNSSVNMTLTDDADDVRIALAGNGTFEVTDYTHGQLSSYTGIPKGYYDRLKLNDPALLADNVNRWLHDPQATNDRRMLRTLDGNVRAFLSDKYRPIDNFDLASAALPVLLKQGSGLRVESCDLTPSRLHIKAVSNRLQGEVKVGDVVQAGVAISNSEIGAGAIKIEPLVFRLRCLNGMISADHRMRKYHIGRTNGAGNEDNVYEFLRDETRAQDDRALFMKVQDVIAAAFSENVFQAILAKMQGSVGRPITGDPVQVVEVTAKRFGLNDTEKAAVLRNLIAEADLTQFGLLNALTATAQDATLNYERATELEHFGGEVLELPATDWKVLAEAV